MDFPKFRVLSGLEFFLISHHHLTKQFSLSNIKEPLVKLLVKISGKLGVPSRGKDTWKSGCKQDKPETKSFLIYIGSGGRK